MQAMVMRSGQLRIDDVPDPVPEAGQVIVKSLACCICASDHHLVDFGPRLAKWSREHDGPFDFDPDADLVMGHEFCGEIVALGPGCEGTHPIGSRVVCQPLLFHGNGFDPIGYSNTYAGGFAEYLALSEVLLHRVPDHLSDTSAALMEPLSTGVLYARIAAVTEREVPVVIGCGAIGLAAIAALKLQGRGPIVAADYSPFRRSMAEAMGADEVVDPAQESAFSAWHRVAPRGSGCVVLECVGATGVLNAIFAEAPWQSRVIVAGQNLDDDLFFTASAHTKAMNVQFGGMPDPSDVTVALEAITSGTVDVDVWQTGHVDLDGAVQAMTDSRNAETHTRIAVHPHGVRA